MRNYDPINSAAINRRDGTMTSSFRHFVHNITRILRNRRREWSFILYAQVNYHVGKRDRIDQGLLSSYSGITELILR